MKDFVAKNEEILKRWEKEMKKNGEYNFAPDGIMFRGEKYNAESGNYSYHESSNNNTEENRLWNEAPLRYLFLTKDQNCGEEDAWDVRTETARKDINSTAIKALFHRNLLYQLWGLTHTTKDKAATYDFSNAQAIDYYDCKCALARINVKKQGGNSVCSDELLCEHLKKYKSYIVEQIQNLDADVMVCCGYSKSIELTGNRILNFLNENGYKFEKENSWIYYDKQKNKIAVNDWHLSYRGVSSEEIFDDLTSAYQEFLKQHPSFLDSHRK